MTITLNTILKEIQDVPVDKLEDVYEYVHSLTPHKKNSRLRKKILSFAGAFSDMSEESYQEFASEIQKSRKELFGKPNLLRGSY
ncbi:MAG: hypothetical protein LCH91_01490 [Bacteroidetes bacterium]|nr:hypothetical protein [Bacteroidota bacterium]